nr:helix-turn-helix domain-containing protein [Endozoicomonas sp.]
TLVKKSLGYLFQEDDSVSSNEDEKEWGIDVDVFLSELQKQPRFSAIMEGWHDPMTGSYDLKDKDATEFLRQVFSILEDDKLIFTHKNVAAHEHRYKGSWNDFHTCRPQTKSGWTLHITRKGSGHYNCVRVSLDTQPGDILLFSPSAYLECKRSDSSEEWFYSWVLFQVDNRIIDLLDWPEVASGIYYIKAKQEQREENVVKVVDRLARLGWSNELNEVRIRATIVEHLMVRCNQLVESRGYHRKDPRIQTAINFIEDNLFTAININKVADAACLSVSGLTQLFKKQCGVSVMQWREEKRMTLACNHLIHSHKRIVQIAEDVGYVNQMYFARCFRRHMKMSPSDYRKKYLAG